VTALSEAFAECEICGHNLYAEQQNNAWFQCKECGSLVCHHCYNEDARMCLECELQFRKSLKGNREKYIERMKDRYKSHGSKVKPSYNCEFAENVKK
jgi:acetyl-CoA carboxylase beta subunit